MLTGLDPILTGSLPVHLGAMGRFGAVVGLADVRGVAAAHLAGVVTEAVRC